jgi:hypothetical protein
MSKLLIVVKGNLKWLARTLVLSVSIALPVFAQSPNPSAGESMDSPGHAMEGAGSDTANAAKDTYHAAKAALRDTEITTKVKPALHEDKATEESDRCS